MTRRDAFRLGHSRQLGFTLVELAIVMTIIGLLIGGILKGQELMRSARSTATIGQIQSYQAATITFRDAYGNLPGDMPRAESRLPGCDANCAPGPQAGNSVVGARTWASTSTWGNQGQFLPSTTVGNAGRETTLFWMHLLAADLISGVTFEGLTTAQAAWGITHPAAPIGGGFVAGYSDGLVPLPGSPDVGSNISGTTLLLLASPVGWPTNYAGNYNILQAKQAAIIDRKMDDGKPASGSVQAYGFPSACFSDAALVYNESEGGPNCGLAFVLK